jgi:hypothetical protein
VLEHVNHADFWIVAIQEDYRPPWQSGVAMPVMTSPVIMGKAQAYVLVCGEGGCRRKLVVAFAPKKTWANLLSKTGQEKLKRSAAERQCIQVSVMSISRGEGVL